MRFLGAYALIMAFQLAANAADFKLDVPKGLGPVVTPANNPLTQEKIELGKQLYFDKRLSRDNSISCASCHDPKKGWSNGEAFATGFNGQKGGRSSPTVINSTYQSLQFWDGRAEYLEGQALGPIQNPIEMNLTLPELMERLNAIEGYRKQFQRVFGTDATSEGVAKAIASFERTVLSGDAPYDRYKAGDATAMTAEAVRGMKLFFGKAHCSACHAGPSFTDGAFHNLGVGMKADKPDLGRFLETKLSGDKGAFKTPTLREIAKTAPYMHDGSEKTLEEVIELYDKGGIANDFLDEEIFPLKLTREEKSDLKAFLVEGLSSTRYPDMEAPALPQ